MANRIVYTRPDGGVSVVIPASSARLIFRYKITVNPDVIGEIVDVPEGVSRDRLNFAFFESDAVVSILNVEGDEEFIKRIADNSVPVDAVNVRIVDVGEMPTDRTFRDAWEDDGKKIKINISKAQSIHMERIRAVRNAELAKLDIPQMTTISKGDTVEAAKIENKKQALRDLPVTFDLTKAKTADELKALWPAELPKA